MLGNCFTGDHPVAKLSRSVKSGSAPLDVTYDASASTDNEGIVNYRFDVYRRKDSFKFKHTNESCF